MTETRSDALRVIMYTKYVAPRYSGAGRQALALAAALRAQGVAITFLTESTAERPTSYEVDGFSIVPFFPATDGTAPKPRRALAFWRALQRLRRADVFHAHSAYAEASMLGLTARLAGLPSVLKVTMHHSDVNVGSSRLVGRVHRQMLLRQNAIVAISSEIRSELLGIGVADARIHAIPNGVDTRRFHPRAVPEIAERRAALGLPDNAPVLLFVGILNARKNVGWLLDRWLEWPGHNRARLVLAGPSPVGEEALRRRVEQLAADPSSGVHWLGAVEHVEQLYPAADLLLLPSEAEGLPNVALEAMASGVPVALADGSGARDVLGPEATGGFLLPRGDQGALAAVFTILEAAPEDLRVAGAAARRRMEEEFAIERIAGRYVALYQELVARDV